MNSPSGTRCPTEKDSEAGQLTRNSRTRSSLKGKQLTRSHAIKESTSPPRCSDQQPIQHPNQQQLITSRSLDSAPEVDGTSKQPSLLFTNHRKRDNYNKSNASNSHRVNGDATNGQSRRSANNKNNSNNGDHGTTGHCYVVSDIVRDERAPDQGEPGQTMNQLTPPGPGVPPPPRLEVVVSPKHRKDETQLNDSIGIDLLPFLADTLNKNQKDRFTMLRIEKELVSLVKDKQRYMHKFPPMSSYNRMLVHRCAAFFGMEHNIDPSQQCVIVSKTAVTKLPPIHFKECVKDISFEEPRNSVNSVHSRSILKRDAHSFDEARTHLRCPDRYYGLDNRRSKSFEEREEAYVKARQRIFKDRASGNNSTEELKYTAWSSTESNEISILNSFGENPHGFRKIQSFDGPSDIYRPIVSKSFSFGGYSGPSNKMSRDDSINSTRSAGARLITKQDSCASGTPWRLSPSSSGYKTQSHSLHSDSITPSPTGHCSITPEPPQSPAAVPVVWAVTDIANVPRGSLLIDPQTGHPFLNKDGSIYTFDPENLPPPNVNNNQYELSSPTQHKVDKLKGLKKASTEESMHDIKEDEVNSQDIVEDTKETVMSESYSSKHSENSFAGATSPAEMFKTPKEEFPETCVAAEPGLNIKTESLSEQLATLEVSDEPLNDTSSPSGTIRCQSSANDNNEKINTENSAFNSVSNSQQQSPDQAKPTNNNNQAPGHYQSVPVYQNNQASVNSYLGEDGCYYPYSEQIYAYPPVVPTMPYGPGQAPVGALYLPDGTPYAYSYGSGPTTNMQPIVYPTYGGHQSMIYQTTSNNVFGYVPTQPVFYASIPHQSLMSMNNQPMNSLNTNSRPGLIPQVSYPFQETIPSMMHINPAQMSQLHLNQVQTHPAELPIAYNFNTQETASASSNVPQSYNQLYMNYPVEHSNYVYPNNRHVMYVESTSPPNAFTRQNSLSSDGFYNASNMKSDLGARNFAPVMRPMLPRNSRVPEQMVPRTSHYDANLNRVLVHTKPLEHSYAPFGNSMQCNYNSGSSTVVASPRDHITENTSNRLPLLDLSSARMALPTQSSYPNSPRMAQPFFIQSAQGHQYMNTPNVASEEFNTANLTQRNDSYTNGNASYIAPQVQSNYNQNPRMKFGSEFRRNDGRRH